MPRTRRIHLQRRDLAILEALASRRAETLEHLHDHHFAGLSRKRAVNRLGDLAAHGYLVRVEVADAQGAMRNAYVLGPKRRRRCASARWPASTSATVVAA